MLDNLKVLVGETQIQKRVDELARQISQDYRDEAELVVVGVLKGAFIFMADIVRRLSVPHTVDFIAVASYDLGKESSGTVRLVMDVRENIAGKHVLIIEDIVDSGRTLHYLKGLFDAHKPASVRTCVLVRKERETEHNVEIDYLGFDIPDKWVVGYGLDMDERWRTLPYIGIVPETA